MISPITLQNSKINNTGVINSRGGFLLPEMMIAFSLMIFFLTSILILSITTRELRQYGIMKLEKLEQAVTNIAYATSSGKYGNDTTETYAEPLILLNSDYANAWGRDSCNANITFNMIDPQIISQGIDLGSGNVSTDIEVRDKIVYLTADSAIASAPDFYVIDIHDPNFPIVLSSLDTGPGLSALEVAGPFIYALNKGTTNHLQIIDIHDRLHPLLISKLKLPLPQATSTPPLATSIFYSKSLIYLGTQKWAGNEFSIIDVSNPTSPRYLGGFETNTIINDIYERDGLAYIATAGAGQMMILDVHNPSSITQVASFSPSGWETQTGTAIGYFQDKWGFGRTTGGFNVLNHHEIFTFSTTTPITLESSHDIPGGVYGILMRPPRIFLASRSVGHEFQIWNDDLSSVIFDKSLGFLPQTMVCDGQTLYFATGDQKGIVVLKLL